MSTATLSGELARMLDDFQQGNRTALARALSVVENRRPGFEAFLSALHPRLGRAHRIGITGPPGAGKSTLSSALTRLYREKGERVGVIAVDPTSPFTGGALLGDRIRMNDVALDPGVFIRSMATRGSLGGLAITTKEAADVMDAFGFERVIIETVGVGQSELGIAGAADSTVLVLVPESGDSIQAMKAGLMEAADLFVINKADRPGADRIAREIQLMLHLRLGPTLRNVPAHHGVNLKTLKKKAAATPAPAHAPAPAPEAWGAPVLQTVAETAAGVPELAAMLDQHLEWLQDSGEFARRRRQRLAERVREVVERRLQELVWRERGGEQLLEEAQAALESGSETPYIVAARIVESLTGTNQE